MGFSTPLVINNDCFHDVVNHPEAFVLPPNVALALGKALVQVATSKGASL